MNKISFLDRPVFICGHRKGGTTLLVNLLDNNQECMTIPGDNGFFYLYYPYLIDSSLSKKKAALKSCNQKILKEIKNLHIDDKYKNKLIKKYYIFSNYVNLIKKNDNFTKILKIRAHYFAKTFDRMSAKIWVEKTSSTEIYAQTIKKSFKNSKFIHIIRDPRDNWASLKSGWKTRYNKNSKSLNHLMFSLVFRVLNSFKFAILNEKLLGKKNYLIIKYEDLIFDQKRELKKIQKFLGLKKHINLNTTFLNFNWKSNNFIGEKKTKLAKININKYKKTISVNEIKAIEFYFYDYLKKFNYKINYKKENVIESAEEFYKETNKLFFQ
tara:strand:- start:8630 stop:9604 length:975 start_codon:yes stop_codon:yes gene_type:complete